MPSPALSSRQESIIVGWAIWAIGLGLFSTLNEHSNLGSQIGFAILTGVGVGQTLQPSLIAIQAGVASKEMAVVTGTRKCVSLLASQCQRLTYLQLREESGRHVRPRSCGHYHVFPPFSPLSVPLNTIQQHLNSIIHLFSCAQPVSIRDPNHIEQSSFRCGQFRQSSVV